MASSLVPLLFSSFLFFSFSCSSSAIFEETQVLRFNEGFIQIFGDSNLMLLRDGKSVQIALDERTGAGFASQDLYLHGFFSAAIKLPPDYAAGVVVAFYMSNGDIYEKNHDELDFEFLGNIRGKEWRIQTNVYGNGSTAVGREERYNIWFDPTEDFHHYSILWTHNHVIFYIDEVPIREVVRSESMGGAFPSKPMSLYATIWDGSSWATSGGRYKVSYKLSPYVAEFRDLILHGCAVDPIDQSSSCNMLDGDRLNAIQVSSNQRSSMESFRSKYVSYSYCYDRSRYPVPLPECSVYQHKLRKSYRSNGVKFGDRRRHGRQSRQRSPASHTDSSI